MRKALMSFVLILLFISGWYCDVLSEDYIVKVNENFDNWDGTVEYLTGNASGVTFMGSEFGLYVNKARTPKSDGENYCIQMADITEVPKNDVNLVVQSNSVITDKVKISARWYIADYNASHELNLIGTSDEYNAYKGVQSTNNLRATAYRFNKNGNIEVRQGLSFFSYDSEESAEEFAHGSYTPTTIVVGRYSLETWYQVDYIWDVPNYSYEFYLNGQLLSSGYIEGYYQNPDTAKWYQISKLWGFKFMETDYSAGNIIYLDDLHFEKISPIQGNINYSFTNVPFENSLPEGFKAIKTDVEYVWNTYGYKANLGGKAHDDYAFFISTEDYRGQSIGNTKAGDPYCLISTPLIRECAAIEASLYSSGDKSCTYLGTKINAVYVKLFELKENGQIALGGNIAGNWESNRWYTFAVNICQETGEADFFINGEPVLQGVPIREMSSQKIYEVQNLKICCDATTYAAKNVPVNNISAFDNIKMYAGHYNPDSHCINIIGAELTDRNEIIIRGIKNKTDFESSILCSNMQIYKDSSLTAPADVTVQDGYILVAKSQNEETIVYKKIVDLYINSPYEIDEQSMTISVPPLSTAVDVLSNITVAAGAEKIILSSQGEIIDGNDTVYDGYILRIFNRSGHTRRFNISSAANEKKNWLKSSKYYISSYRNEYQISNIPWNLNSNIFMSSLLAENPDLSLVLYHSDLKYPVVSEVLDDTMVIEARSKTDNTVNYYHLKIGVFNKKYEDFENYNEGAFSSTEYWSVTSPVPNSVFSEIVSDGGNKCIKFNVSGDYTGESTHIQTGYNDMKRECEISFRVKTHSGNNVYLNAYLRDAGSGSLGLVSIYKNRITFFSGYAPKDFIADDGWQTVTLKLVPSAYRIEGYCNGILIGYIDNYSDYVSAFDFSKCMVRFHALSNNETSQCYLDDIVITDDMDIGSLYAQETEIYYKDSNNSLTPLDTLVEGDLVLRTHIWNMTNYTSEAIILAALIKDNSEVRFFQSELVSLNGGERKTIDLPVYFEDLEFGDRLKIFVFESLDTIKPWRKAAEYVRGVLHIPSEAELKDMFYKKSNRAHPWIMASADDFNNLKVRMCTDDYIKEWSGRVLEIADDITENLTNDKEQLLSPYYIGYTTALNSGQQILEISRRVKNFAINLGMAYQLTGDTKYSDGVWKLLSYAGKPDSFNPQPPEEFPDWNPSHFLDTAEMAAGFAIGYDWCFDAFTPEQKSFIENSILEYGISNGNSNSTIYTWYKRETNNWNIVCNSGMILAAMAVADIYPDDSFKLLADSLSSLRYSLPGFSPDGSWSEGTMYGLYSMEYLSYMLSTLNCAYGDDFGISSISGLDKALDYFIHIDGPTGANNYNDSNTIHINNASLMYFANVYKKPEYMVALMQKMREYTAYGGALNLLWYKPEYNKGDFEFERNQYFANNEVVTLRHDWSDPNSAWLSFQGGYSVNSHGHLDSGAFVYDCDNIRWAMDLGNEAYTAGYSSSERWNYYRARAEGHNTLVINPDKTGGQDLNAYSKVTKFSDGSNGSMAILDMSDCYKTQAHSVVRGYKLTDNGCGLLIRDEINLKQDNSVVYWFMHTSADARVIDNNTIVLSSEGVKKTLTVSCSSDDFELYVTEAKPLPYIDDEISITDYPNPADQSNNANVKKIMIKIKGGGQINLNVQLMPLGQLSSEDISIPLSQW